MRRNCLNSTSLWDEPECGRSQSRMGSITTSGTIIHVYSIGPYSVRRTACSTTMQYNRDLYCTLHTFNVHIFIRIMYGVLYPFYNARCIFMNIT